MLQSKDGQPFGFFPLTDLPPGIWRNGTGYQAKNRWCDANLIDFEGGAIRPWLGWVPHSTVAVTGVARALFPFWDLNNLPWIAAGTESHAFVYSRSGAQTDITPAGFTAGRADAVRSAGYGGGPYGVGPYGRSRGLSTNLQDASVWTLDTLQGYLIGCMSDDGKVYSWDGDTANDFTQCGGSPTSCAAIFVTNEDFIFALGADGDPRKVSWPDQDSLTGWTPTDTNRARSLWVASSGKLMAGVRMTGANLMWTSTDVHVATYLGLPAVYGFQQAGTGCGLIGRAAFAKAEGFVAWMSITGFWVYDGAVRALHSTVWDDVRRNLNQLQRSKVWAIHRGRTVTWFYPSIDSNEIDRYVAWNYMEDHWTVGRLARTAGYEAGVFQWPLMAGVDGVLYQHEVGSDYGFLLDSDGAPILDEGGGLIGGDSTTYPYIETGPLELGAGDQVFDVLQIEPDALSLGYWTATFYSRFHANEDDTVSSAYPLTNPTDVRVAGREHRVRFAMTIMADDRLGPGTRIDIRPSGRR